MRTPLFGALLAFSLVSSLPVRADSDVPLVNWTAPPLWRFAQPLPEADSLVERASAPETGSADALSALSVPTAELVFVGITPCRVADTRSAAYPPGYGTPWMPPGTVRDFTITGQCGIPANAQAVSFNFTVTDTAGAGFLLVYPKGAAVPSVSTLNYAGGQTIANAAVVPLGTGGGISVIPGASGFNLIIDVNGYYAPGTGFVPLSGGIMTGELIVGPAAGARALSLSGNRSAGAPYTAPVALVANNSAASTAAPALRVWNSSAASNSPDGVLNVSNHGTGLLARFGNLTTWVTSLDTNGNLNTTGTVSANGSLSAGAGIVAGGNLGIGGNASVTGDLAARNLPGAEYYFLSSAFSDSVPQGGSLDVLVPASTVSIPASASAGVLLVSGTLSLDFNQPSPSYSGSFCAVVDLREGATVLATTREQFLISVRGATAATIQYATTVPAGAATRTFQLRVSNCMSGATNPIYINDRALSATYLPVRY
ncbi:MAG: hypothetical protein IPP07_26005 [Holophagales bacterium]|nr:hypothetical protein [Holophagales bacterium]